MLTNSPTQLDNCQITPFESHPRTRLIFGAGVVNRVGELAAEIGAQHVLLVTDRGIVDAGHADRVRQCLEAAGLRVYCYAGVRENPSESCVQDCVDFARQHPIDALIGLGGGSSLDTAKGCNFVLTNGGRMRNYWGLNKAKNPMLPLIAIPTTGGTGSECQSYALISHDETHQKMACGDAKAAARVALLDPALTLSQPLSVTACTGIDAVTHALESAVTTKRNPVSMLYSKEAFRLTFAGFPRVLSSPQDLDARGMMLLGAAWAGTAIENSMLGAAHSAANPLTAHYGIIHGQAVGMMLPHVIRFNASHAPAANTYEELGALAGIAKGGGSPAEALAKAVEELLKLAGFPRSLADLGVEISAVPKLAAEASSQWTAKFNPRPVTTEDFVQIYSDALTPPPAGIVEL